jgi:tellurite resistance protein TerC
LIPTEEASAAVYHKTSEASTVDPAVLTIILQLIFLECILSIDNAAVIGAMVANLPDDQPTPWPARLRRLLRPLDRILGPQRQAALKVGLLGAYAGRITMLALASLIVQNVWVQVAGALYLIYLALRHFFDEYQERSTSTADERRIARSAQKGFWGVVVTIELADLAFSLDNVVAAVSLSDRLWAVVLGVAIGILVIRFAATLFTRLIYWEPALEHAAYLLLIAIGVELILEKLFHVEISDLVKFGVSLAVLALTVIVARARSWYALGHATEMKHDA